MIDLLLIAIGGALGSITRYLSAESIIYHFRTASFPYSTIFVNVLGSLLAGIFFYFMINNLEVFSPKLKNLILIGFLGGFTTFSTFSLDVLRLFNAGQYNIALTYIALSVTLSITAIFFGFYLTKILMS